MQKNTIFFTLVLAVFFSFKSFSQVQVTKVYWANYGTIQSSNIDGTDIQTVLDYRAVSIQIDNDNKKMYYTGNGTEIFRANLDGTGIETIVPGVSAGEIALDLANQKVYWVEFNNDRVRRANLDGTNIENLVINTQDPAGLGLDLTNGKVYWAMYNSGRIRRANLDGTNPEDIVTSGLQQPWTIRIDEANSKMYYTDRETLRRANLDGSAPEDLSTKGFPQGLGLDIEGGKIYIASSSLSSINIDGTNEEELIDRDGVGSSVWALAFETEPVDATAPVFSDVNPSSNTTVASADVGYTLSEDLASGTITFTRTDGTEDANSPHVVTLTGDELNAGTRATSALTSAPTLVSGAIYTISFDGQDAAENNAITVSATDVTFQDPTLSVEAPTENRIRIYPNPVSNQLIISAASINVLSWSLTDVQGKSIKKGTLAKQTIDMSGITTGVYILRLQTENDTFYKRILKE